MKRFISAIICLILVVALVGCGQNNAAQDEGKSGSAAASQLDAIKSAGVLKVGIEGTYKTSPVTTWIWPRPLLRSWV